MAARPRVCASHPSQENARCWPCVVLKLGRRRRRRRSFKTTQDQCIAYVGLVFLRRGPEASGEIAFIAGWLSIHCGLAWYSAANHDEAVKRIRWRSGSAVDWGTSCHGGEWLHPSTFSGGHFKFNFIVLVACEVGRCVVAVFLRSTNPTAQRHKRSHADEWLHELFSGSLRFLTSLS